MTLQEQYNLIKEGKGHKGIFLTEAKKQFPNMLTNPMGFEETTKILKTRGVISENYVDLKPINTIEASPKLAWENKFAQFLAEEAKVEEKKTTKEVEEIQEHGYDYKDKNNLDNQIGQEVLNGLYFEGRENPDKTLDELRKIVEKNLAKDGQYYMKNAAFGVKGLGYQETEMMEVSGKHKSSGYSDKLKKMVKESLVKEEELPTTPVEKRPFVSAEKLKQVLQVLKKIQLKGSDPMSTTEIGSESDLMRFLLGLRFKQVRPGVYHLEGPNDSTVTMGKGSLDEASDFEDKMAQLRIQQLQKKMGTAPDQKVINKIKKLEKDLANAQYALFSLESDSSKEPELLYSFWENWYQEQFDDIMDSINSIKSDLSKYKSLNENMEVVDMEEAEVEKKEEAEPKPEKKKVKKESLDSDLAEIDTQARVVAMEAKLDRVSEMISTKMERLNMIGEDVNLAELVDKSKLKEMQKEIKVLEKVQAKMMKEYEKMTGGKKYTKEEIVDETQIEEYGDYDIKKKIEKGEINPEEVQAAAEKAKKGDSTDLAMLMALPK